MDIVTSILTKPDYIQNLTTWIHSKSDGKKLEPDDFKQMEAEQKNNDDANYYAGVYCLIHTNLSGNAIKYLEESKSTNAMVILGDLYYYFPQIVKHDVIKAIEYYTKAFSFGNLYACHQLACVYGFDENYKETSQYFVKYLLDCLDEKSYEVKCTPITHGTNSVRLNMLSKIGDQKNFDKYAEKAKSDGCGCCYSYIGHTYHTGTFGETDYNKAIKNYIKCRNNKCYIRNDDWNISSCYQGLGDIKMQVFYAIKSLSSYSGATLDETRNIVHEMLIANPTIMLELIKEGVMTFKIL